MWNLDGLKRYLGAHPNNILDQCSGQMVAWKKGRTTTLDTHQQYTAIGGLKKLHTYSIHPDEIAKEIAVPFNLYVTIFDVTYRPPSFIICLSKGNLQANLLSEQTLHAASFDLEMLPWCKEHELAQLPWMIDPRHLCGSRLHLCHFNKIGARASEQCLQTTKRRDLDPHHYCRQGVSFNTNGLDLYGIKLYGLIGSRI